MSPLATQTCMRRKSQAAEYIVRITKQCVCVIDEGFAVPT
jgi:hypothetical protein